MAVHLGEMESIIVILVTVTGRRACKNVHALKTQKSDEFTPLSCHPRICRLTIGLPCALPSFPALSISFAAYIHLQS